MQDLSSLNYLPLYVRNNAAWISILDRFGFLNEITPTWPRGGSKSSSGSSTQDDTFPMLAQLQAGSVSLAEHWHVWR
jgi:hypothetical protein